MFGTVLARSLYTQIICLKAAPELSIATLVSLGIETRFRNCSGVSHYYTPKQHAGYPARTLL